MTTNEKTNEPRIKLPYNVDSIADVFTYLRSCLRLILPGTAWHWTILDHTQAQTLDLVQDRLLAGEHCGRQLEAAQRALDEERAAGMKRVTELRAMLDGVSAQRDTVREMNSKLAKANAEAARLVEAAHKHLDDVVPRTVEDEASDDLRELTIDERAQALVSMFRAKDAALKRALAKLDAQRSTEECIQAISRDLASTADKLLKAQRTIEDTSHALDLAGAPRIGTASDDMQATYALSLAERIERLSASQPRQAKASSEIAQAYNDAHCLLVAAGYAQQGSTLQAKVKAALADRDAFKRQREAYKAEVARHEAALGEVDRKLTSEMLKVGPRPAEGERLTVLLDALVKAYESDLKGLIDQLLKCREKHDRKAQALDILTKAAKAEVNAIEDAYRDGGRMSGWTRAALTGMKTRLLEALRRSKLRAMGVLAIEAESEAVSRETRRTK